MKWLLKMLGIGVALLLVVGILVSGLGWLSAKTSVGAQWLAQRWLATLIDPRIEVLGPAEVSFWPQLSLKASDVVIPADLADVAPACLAGNPKDDPAALRIKSMEWVLDWQRLLSRQIVVPVFSAEGVVLTQGVLPAQHQQAVAARGLDYVRQWLANDATSGWGAGWRLQLDTLVLKQLQLQRCLAEQGMQTVLDIAQMRLALRPVQEQAAQAEWIVDGFDWRAAALPKGLASVLQESGFIRGGRLQLETVRSRWLVESAQAQLTSLLWVGDGPAVEAGSGRVDLQNATLDLLLTLQTTGGGSVLKVPGVEIILRRSSLPLHIYGDWSAPVFQLGQE